MTWLPEGIAQEAPDASLLSPKVERREAPSAWSEEFWNEPESSGLDLVRHDLLIRGRINSFAGHFEHGKTMVVGDLAHKWARSTGPVLYLDWEMGSRRVRKRMKSHGWTFDLASKRARYSYSPPLHQPRYLHDLVGFMGEECLVVIDSLSAALMSMGRDENNATQVGEWWNQELIPVIESLGATVALIGQVAKGSGGHSSYVQRGTGATAFGSDVMWLVERFAKFTPEQAGKIRLLRKKDREGVLPERLGFALGGDGEDRIVLRPLAEAPKGEPADEAVLEAVRSVLGGTEAVLQGGVAKTALVKQIENYGEAPIMTALEQLKEDGEADATLITTGKGAGGVRWFLVPDVHVPDAPPLD